MPEAGAPSRITTLDVIRGVAVMGILAMNITGFALPEQVTITPLVYGMDSAADRLSWLVDFLLIDGRMRGLFAFLFGASMLLVIERADTAGLPSARIHFARMAWLLVFGLIHFYLIWWGDILALYAIVGMIAWFLAYRPAANLVQIAILLFFAQTAVELQGALTDIDPIGWESERIAMALNLYSGSYLDIFTYRIGAQFALPLLSLMLTGWETLGYMLLGMAALKSGFLTGGWSDRSYKRIAAGGLAVGVPIYAILAWAQIDSGYSEDAIRTWNFTTTTPLRPIMVMAYAALIILWSRRMTPLVARVAAAGRAAFTNYLGTSLVMTFIFYGWGLGWYGTLGRAELWLVVLPTWALMLLWSKPWLDRFRYGPLEWLWRSLARGRPQPMRGKAV